MKIGVSLPIREMKNDLGAIKAFAQLAEELGMNHLRVPDQVLRPDSGHLHEPMTMMSYIAAVTVRYYPSITPDSSLRKTSCKPGCIVRRAAAAGYRCWHQRG